MLKNPLTMKSIFQKIEVTQDLLKSYDLSISLKGMASPNTPARDAEVKPPKEHPNKKGLTYLVGKQRLLHDLASIELQAMELGIRTLIEFQNKPDIPEDFLRELAQITYEESEHCKLCLDLLEKLEGKWSDFPIHLGLWNASNENDTILERLLKVHRYLEGSGLDATFKLANRLKGIKGAEELHDLILKISHDELKHVQFGSKWFAYFCEQEELSRISECKRILKKSIDELPYRREPIQDQLRLDAGFLSEEIKAFRDFQKELCI